MPDAAACSKRFALDPGRGARDQAMAELLSHLTPQHAVSLNPGGHAAAVLWPEHLRRLVRLVRGELTLDAIAAGPTTKIMYGAPAAPRLDVHRAAARAASRHPEIASVHAGQGQIEEPGTLPFVLLGFRLQVEDATAALDDVEQRSGG